MYEAELVTLPGKERYRDMDRWMLVLAGFLFPFCSGWVPSLWNRDPQVQSRPSAFR